MIFSPTCSQAACVAGVEETRLVHLSGLNSALVTLKDLEEDAGKKRSLFRTPFFLFQKKFGRGPLAVTVPTSDYYIFSRESL